jgi:hypothetical protein
MGTATLKSIFERIVDQMTKTENTVKRPSHKNGEEITLDKKMAVPEKSARLNVPAIRALFLKQKWMNVSRISEKISNSSIIKVTFFLAIA